MTRTYFLSPQFPITMHRIILLRVEGEGIGEGDARAINVLIAEAASSGIGEGEAEMTLVMLAEAIASGIGEAIALGFIMPRKICVTLSIDGRETTLEINTHNIDLSVMKREIKLSLKKFLNKC